MVVVNAKYSFLTFFSNLLTDETELFPMCVLIVWEHRNAEMQKDSNIFYSTMYFAYSYWVKAFRPGISVKVNPVRIYQSMALSNGTSSFMIYLP